MAAIPPSSLCSVFWVLQTYSKQLKLSHCQYLKGLRCRERISTKTLLDLTVFILDSTFCSMRIRLPDGMSATVGSTVREMIVPVVSQKVKLEYNTWS